jgi:hypothetical protein
LMRFRAKTRVSQWDVHWFIGSSLSTAKSNIPIPEK